MSCAACGQSALATVGKNEITIDEFRRAYQDEISRFRAASAVASRPRRPSSSASCSALARLTGVAAVDIHARELGLTATTEIVVNVIRARSLIRRADGQFHKNSSTSDRQNGYQSEGATSGPPPGHRARTVDRDAGCRREPHAARRCLYRFRKETRVIEYFAPDYDKLIKIADPDEES